MKGMEFKKAKTFLCPDNKLKVLKRMKYLKTMRTTTNLFHMVKKVSS